MSFRTLLAADQTVDDADAAQPDWFRDLFLDQIIASVTRGREHYNLRPLFHAPARASGDIAFRQAIVTDLKQESVRAAFDAFASALDRMRDRLALAEKHRHPLQKQHRILEAVRASCDGLLALARDLEKASLSSPGLQAWRAYLGIHLASEGFIALERRSCDLTQALSSIRYTVLIEGLRVRIDPFVEEPDYGEEIRATYVRFDQDVGEGFHFPVSHGEDFDLIEERILEEVARAFARPFADLEEFAHDPGAAFRDEVVERVDRELQFYLAWLDYLAPMEQAGLFFCLPEVSGSKAIEATDSFDLALAHGAVGKGQVVVPNNFALSGRERTIVVSGPNQGGKTTFARMIGQLHHIGCLGLPVPGRSARLHRFDSIFTLFERSEVAGSLHGKLQDELTRLHAIVEAATGDSLVILNEVFASTTFRDAWWLSERIAGRLRQTDLLCVWVSFLDGLTTVSDTMVSMVSTVKADDPTTRTFRIERREADNLAYARALATKYALTREQLEERLAS